MATQIVYPVFADDNMRNLFEDMYLWRLGAYLTGYKHDRVEGHRRGLDIFYSFGVLPRRGERLQRCPRQGCSGLLRSNTDSTRKLGWRFRCEFGHRIEPSTNTFFEQSRLSELGADAILMLMEAWLEQLPLMLSARMTKISPESTVSWYRYFRNVALKAAWHEYLQIGGPHDIVEVDELQLLKQKHKQESTAMLEECWVLGGISRTTRKLFLKSVPRRDTEHLLPLLQDYVDSDSFICSDMWNAYDQCNGVFAGHGRINQSAAFLEPPFSSAPLWAPPGRFHDRCLDHRWRGQPPQHGMQPYRCHIQNIENAWKRLKKIVGSCTSRDVLDGYLGEFMYRQNVLSGLPQKQHLQRFLLDIQRAYPGIGKEPMADEFERCRCHVCRPLADYNNDDDDDDDNNNNNDDHD